jgi:hypothetical protein
MDEFRWPLCMSHHHNGSPHFIHAGTVVMYNRRLTVLFYGRLQLKPKVPMPTVMKEIDSDNAPD